MKTNIEIESHTESETPWILPITDDEASEFDTINDLSSERLAELAERYYVHPDFMIEINSQFDSFRRAVHADLSTIWKRLDSLEK